MDQDRSGQRADRPCRRGAIGGEVAQGKSMISPDDAERQLAAALGRIGSGLFILTLRHPEGETGMLASWVQQCSFHPPLITLAVKRERDMANLLVLGARLTLNILEEGQTDMIAHFGKGFALQEDAFGLLRVTRRADAGPILNESLAYLDAEVIDRIGAGDHDLIIANVVAGRMLD